MANAGQAVFNIGEKLQRVRVEEEVGKATVEATKQLNQAEWDATTDNDVLGFDEKYNKRLQDIRSSVLSNIKNQEAKDEFGKRIDLEMVNSTFKIKQIGYRKLIDQRKNTMFNEELPTITERYLAENNPQLKQQYGDQGAALFKGARDSGIISREDAGKGYLKWKSELFAQQIKHDALANPQAVLTELEKGENGLYKGITQEIRDEGIAKAKIELRRLEALRKDEYDSKMYVLNTRVLQNDVNEEEIDQLVKMNEQNPDFGIPAARGRVLKTALYSQIEKDVKTMPKAKKYIKAANMVFSNTAERVKAYDAILEAFDGNQTKDEMNYLNELLNGSKMSANMNTTNTLKEVWRGFRTAIGFQKPDIEKEAELIKKYINKVRGGDAPATAAQATLYEQQVADHPALLGNPEAITAIYTPGKGTTYLNAKKPKEEKKK
jgi:hypothetical protein